MERHVRALLRLPSSVFTFEFVFFGFTWDCTILPPSFKFRPVSVQEKEEEKSLTALWESYKREGLWRFF